MIKKIITFMLVATLTVASSCPCISGAKAEAQYYCDTMYLDGAGGSTTHYVDIPYDTYTMNEVYLTRFCPEYSSDASLPNSCAPTAGTTIIGYYDYTCANLVPNFNACYIYNGKYYYRATTVEIQAVNEELYDLMGTNTEAPGTSATQFKNGLREYVEDCGYNITYTQCGNRINVNTVLTYFNLQQPVALFMNSYYYYTIEAVADLGDSIGMAGTYSTNGHVAVAFGLREYVITKDNVTTSYKYLAVSFGDCSLGFIPVNDTSIFEEAYAVNIYS